MLPLLVSSNLPIGRRLSQNGISEAKVIGRTKGGAVTKGIARRRHRRRSKDRRGRVKWRCKPRTMHVVVSDLTRRTQLWWGRRDWWWSGRRRWRRWRSRRRWQRQRNGYLRWCKVQIG
jgi:hypothetical protein